MFTIRFSLDDKEIIIIVKIRAVDGETDYRKFLGGEDLEYKCGHQVLFISQ